MPLKNEQIRIESLIEEINNQFDDIAEIYVAHLPTASDISGLHITVHTGEAESLEQSIEVASADEVTIDLNETEPISVPFNVIATFDGPGHISGAWGTTVYMDDNVSGAEPRELDTGLSMLRQKLAGTCPVCEETIDSFGDHYRAASACQEAEQA